MITKLDKTQIAEMNTHDGIVCIGTGGDLKDWVDGINEILLEDGVVDTSEYFTEVFSFTTGEVTNLLFPFQEIMDGFDISKMCIVRIKYSHFMKWLSDYIVNSRDLLEEVKYK